MGLDIYLTLRDDEECERVYHFRKQQRIIDIAIDNGMEVSDEEYESGMIGEKELDIDTLVKIQAHYQSGVPVGPFTVLLGNQSEYYEDLTEILTLASGPFTCTLTADW